MARLLHLVTCYLFYIKTNEAARILSVYPVPSFSHQAVFRSLTLELLKQGHEVVVITTNPAFPNGQSHPNLTEIDMHDISFNTWRENFVKNPNHGDHMSQFKLIMELWSKVFYEQLKTKEVQDLMNDKKNRFDLLLTELCSTPSIIFSHIFKIPVIQVSSFAAFNEHYKFVGSPVHPILYPTALVRKLNNLTLWDKITQIYYEYYAEKIIEDNEMNDDKMLAKHFGPNTPKLAELKNNVEMIFLNVHPIFDGIRPITPNVIYLGGIHQVPEKKLPEDLKLYLDSSKNGVIYVSYGTNVDPTLFPPERIQILVKVFSQLPYDVLWKWNKDELPGRTENIKISKWLPQLDVLRHPKVKLFITQGGLQSTDEAITAAVPLIGMPMMADQWYNAEKYIYHKIGARVDMETISEELFMKTIKTVIEDESYHQNILRLRDLIDDQPQKPLERAVWWVEYILRHGGASHLRSPAANITWWDYLELDVVLTVIGILLAVISTVVATLYYVCRFIKNYVNPVKTKTA